MRRKEEFGGDKCYPSYKALEKDFAEKQLHPGDLKRAVAAALNEVLEPIRKYWRERPELTELTKQAYPEQPAAEAKTSAPTQKQAQGPVEKREDVTAFDLRCGKVVSAEPHPQSEHLLVLQVDVGDASPRTIVAGIAEYYKPEILLDKRVLVLCNLKKAKLRGVMSEGMILCAEWKSKNEDGSVGETRVELVQFPAETKAGTPLQVTEAPVAKGFTDLNLKQKWVQDVLGLFSTNDSCTVVFDGKPTHTKVTVKSVKNGRVR